MVARSASAAFGRPRRGISPLGWALRGAAAGAAGSTALNASTYLDMAVRGRDTSSTPEESIEKLADEAHVPIPGSAAARANRVHGLAPLLGLVVGVGFGALTGLARAAGWRPPPPVGVLLTTAGAMVVANGPMTVLGTTDPRRWSAADWLSDVVPHLAYAAVVTTTLDAFDEGPRLPPPLASSVTASRGRRRRRAPAPAGRRARG